MEELEALLKDLESSGIPQKSPKSPKIPRETPPGAPAQGPEQLYSSVRRPRPPPAAPPPPALGELERLLRDLSPSGAADELLAPPPEDEPEFGGSPPGRESGTPPGSPKFGGGVPKSAASRELERLMGELQLQQPQPPPAPPGQELELLLQRLREELWGRGVPTPPRGVCGGCGNQILGETVVTALGRTWHPEHFCCSHCGDVLGSEGFQERGGRPFCPRDFGELFGPRCRRCRAPVTGEFVAALGGLWHPECFVCQDCHAPFPGGSFFHLGGIPLCLRHFRERGEGPAWGRG